jgi:hypothetical protein
MPAGSNHQQRQNHDLQTPRCSFQRSQQAWLISMMRDNNKQSTDRLHLHSQHRQHTQIQQMTADKSLPYERQSALALPIQEWSGNFEAPIVKQQNRHSGQSGDTSRMPGLSEVSNHPSRYTPERICLHQSELHWPQVILISC